MRGKDIQRELIKFAKKELKALAYKTETPGQNGEPDIKVLFKGPRWYYIEIKGDNDTLSPLQVLRISDYRKFGQICYVVESIEEGKEILRWHQTHQRPYPHYSRGKEKLLNGHYKIDQG